MRSQGLYLTIEEYACLKEVVKKAMIEEYEIIECEYLYKESKYRIHIFEDVREWLVIYLMFVNNKVEESLKTKLTNMNYMLAT